MSMLNKNNTSDQNEDTIDDLSDSSSDGSSLDDSSFTNYESTAQYELDKKELKREPWIKDLKRKKLQSELWKCSLIFLLETDPSFHGAVQMINNALECHKRKAVRIITPEKVHKMALDNCFKSGKKRTPFSVLCEAVRLAGGYKFRNKIPAELLAYMIKYMILFEKESFLKAEYKRNFIKCRDEKRYRALVLNYDVYLSSEEEEDIDENDTSDDQKEAEISKIRGKKETVKGNNDEKVDKRKQDEKKIGSKQKVKTGKTIEEVKRATVERTATKDSSNKKNNLTNKKTTISMVDQVSSEKNIFAILENDYSTKYLREEPRILWGGEWAYVYEKVDTLLHKRGEINRDLYTYDDSPAHGPNLYVFISSFVEPQLPKILYDIEIPLNCYIFVGCTIKEALSRNIDVISDLLDVSEKNEHEDLCSEYMEKYGHLFSFLSNVFIDQYAKKTYLQPTVVLENLKTDLHEFYQLFFTNVGDPKINKNYEEVIMTKYVPDVSKSNFNSEIFLKKFLKTLSQDITCIGYYFHKVIKLYECYLKSIPATRFTPAKPAEELEMSFYNLIMSMVPNDVINEAFILDTLISQVCINLNENLGFDLNNYKEFNVKDKEIVETMEEKVTTLKRQYFPELNVKPEEVQSNFVLFGDRLSLNTHRLKDWGQLVYERSLHILQVFFKREWILKTRNARQHDNNDAHQYLNLLKACKYLDINCAKSVIDLLLCILSPEIGEATVALPVQESEKSEEDLSTEEESCKNSVDVSIDTNFAAVMEALKNVEKNIKRQQKETDLKSSCKLEEICHEIKRKESKKSFLDKIKARLDEEQIIDLIMNTRYFEEMPKNVFLQTMWEAINEHNTVKVQYLPIVNKLVYTCCDLPSTVTEEGILPTHMCLRDFYKFGLDELEQWCEISEIDYYRRPLSAMFHTEIDKLKDNIIDPIQPTKITQYMDLIDEDFDYPPRCSDIIQSNKINQIEPVPIKIKVPTEHKQVIIPRLYDLDNHKRAPLFTTIREYVFTESTLVTFKVYSQPYNEPDLCIDICQNGHHFIFHTQFYLNDNPKVLRLLHSSGINICFHEDYFKKPLVEVSQRGEDGDFKDIFSDRVNYNQYDSESSFVAEEDTRETKGEESEQAVDYMPEIDDQLGRNSTLFDFNFSLPNGLTMENKYTAEGDLYVKQYFLTKINEGDLIENEECRLHLSDGVLVKMFKDTSVEIYFPCGRFIKYCLYADLNAEEEEEEEVEEEEIEEEEIKQIYDSKVYEESEQGEEESVGKVNKYFLLEPDGRCYNVIRGVRHLIMKKKCEEYNDIFKDLRTVLYEKGPVFTFNGEGIQTVTFLEGTKIISAASISDEEVYCDWSTEELKQWFAGYYVDEIEEKEFYQNYFREMKYSTYSTTQEKRETSSGNKSTIITKKKIDLKEDGFLWITIDTIMIEHPCYVSTIRFPSELEKIVYILPKNIVIKKESNSCFDIEIELDTKIYIRRDEVILEKYNQNELLQRSALWYRSFEDGYELNDKEFLFQTGDKLGNWLTADKELNIQYNLINDIDITDKGVFCENCETFHLINYIPKYSFSNSRRFIMDCELTGTELLHTINVNQFNAAAINNCTKRKSFQENPFVVNIYLIPIEKEYGQWRKRYTDVNVDEGLFVIPSTYGSSWIFPFQKSVSKVCAEFPRVMVLRYLTEFIYEDIYQVFCDIIKVFNMLMLTDSKEIRHEEDMKLKPEVTEKFDGRALPSTIIGKEARYLRKILYLDAIAVVNIKELNLFKDTITLPQPCSLQFKFKRKFSPKHFMMKMHQVHNNIFAPYFDSPEGIAFYILNIVMMEAELIIKRVHINIDVEELFNKPITELTKEDLSDIAIFLELFYDEFWDPGAGVDVNKVVRAAVELSEFFPTMKDALEFNIHYHVQCTVRDQKH